jgi:hypothetical protein
MKKSMAVVYKHMKPSGEVFYIGIGQTKERAYSKVGRNLHWINTVEKYGYEVEILKSDLSWEDACELEQILIEYYGRKDLQKGSLVNLTAGGEGVQGYKHTEKTRHILSNSMNCFYRKEQSRQALKLATMSNTGKRKVEGKIAKEEVILLYNIHTVSELANKVGVSYPTMQSYLKEIGIYEKRKNLSSPTEESNRKRSESLKGKRTKKVQQYSLTGHRLKEYNSVQEASMAVRGSVKHAGSISACCSGKQKTAYGYAWKYKNYV